VENLPFNLSFKVYINAGDKQLDKINYLSELTFITKIDIEFDEYLDIVKSDFLSVFLSEEEKKSIVEELGRLFISTKIHENIHVLFADDVE
jgi:hypothetical protein